jgi:hypothetical protein
LAEALAPLILATILFRRKLTSSIKLRHPERRRAGGLSCPWIFAEPKSKDLHCLSGKFEINEALGVKKAARVARNIVSTARRARQASGTRSFDFARAQPRA